MDGWLSGWWLSGRSLGGFMGQPTSNCPKANYLNTKIVASNFAAGGRR